jgi:adenylate kinase family enzyme
MTLTPGTPFQRALVIGCSGAGKSSFARRLGERTGLPVIHIDRLFWQPGWVRTADDTYIERLSAVVAQERWIIDGNNSSTFDLRMPRADAVFWLDRSRALCIARVLWRVASSYGNVRADMAAGCPERFDWEFLSWIWGFHAKYYPGMRTAIERYGLRDRTVVLVSDAAAGSFLEGIGRRDATAGHVAQNARPS